MLDLFEELQGIIAEFSNRQIEYALCGGLAMAVHALPRATVDIDLLVLTRDLDPALAAAERCGYTIKANPMNFANNRIQIQRISKTDPDSEDLLSLDLLLVTPDIKSAWDTRENFEWENGLITVVSRDGLIELKSIRNSPIDIEDIRLLTESKNES